MLNIGPQELLIILVIALLVVGPQRLPELGRSIGRGLRELRRTQDEVKRAIQVNLDEPNGDAATRASSPRTPAAPKPTVQDPTPTAGETPSADEVREISRSLGRSLGQLRRAREEVQRSFRVDLDTSMPKATPGPTPPAEPTPAASESADPAEPRSNGPTAGSTSPRDETHPGPPATAFRAAPGRDDDARRPPVRAPPSPDRVDRGDLRRGDPRMVPVRPRDRPADGSVLRLHRDRPPGPARDARLRAVLLGSARAPGDQAQAGPVPRTVLRAPGGPVPAVGVHRARAHQARAPDGGALRRELGAAVRAGRARGLLDTAEGPELPAGLRRPAVRAPAGR